MYTATEYKELKEKYGSYSSWAIWNEKNQKNTTVIDDNLNELNTKYVFLGLNPSKLLEKLPLWSNYHVGRHDRKLMFACNNSKLRGSYLGDIFNGIPTTTAKEFEVELKKCFARDPEYINKQVAAFKDEMKGIRIDENTIFIVLGKDARRYFEESFKSGIKNKVVYYCHHSSRVTDENWVNKLWSIKEIGINEIFKKTKRLKSKQNMA